MSEKVELSEESLRRIAAQKVTFRYSVKIHAIIYILVNIALVTINAIFNPTPFILLSWWVVYPVLGWLIGLMEHITAYVLYARGTQYATRGIIFNLVAYIFGMILLVFTDYVTSTPLDWVMYPLIFWGLGLLVQIVLTYLLTRGRSPKSEKKLSGKEKAIEKEMQKMRERAKNQ